MFLRLKNIAAEKEKSFFEKSEKILGVKPKPLT